MGNDGLKIEVDKKEFQGKPQEERDWILFQAIKMINSHGCSYARGRWKKIFAMGGVLGFFGGLAGGILRKFW